MISHGSNSLTNTFHNATVTFPGQLLGISRNVFTHFHLLSAYHSSDTILKDQRWALLATHYLLA